MNRNDAIVVGGGIGGLSAAALLQANGVDTILLEARDYVGGCAATFHHGGRASEAGATWLTGLEAGMPLERLFTAIGIDATSFGIPEPSPMAVIYRGKQVRRWSDPLRWNDELDRTYGVSAPKFWESVHADAASQWERSRRLRAVPPRSIDDIRKTVLSLRPADAGLVRGLRPTSAYAARSGLESLMPLLDAQLMITTQSPARRVPWLYGAPGLDFAALPARWVAGGIGGVAERIARRFKELGGTLECGDAVVHVTNEGSNWRVTTDSGRSFTAGQCILNLVHGAAAGVTGGATRNYFERLSRRYRPSTGACDLHFRVADRFEDPDVRFFQAVLDEPLPVTGSRSYFVTVSPSGDPVLSAGGKRNVNVSTHTPLATWRDLPDEDYRVAKERLTNAILEHLRGILPAFDTELESLHAGTPRTFERFVGRTDGAVGGYPLTFRNLPWRVPGPVTPFQGLWQVGDNVFPGQSIPGTALGALNLAERLLGKLPA